MKIAIIYGMLAVVLFTSCRKSEYELTEKEVRIITANSGGVGTTTWTNDNDYILDGFVFVNPGQTLIIEPGTVIKAKTGQGENASALVVARGGKIFANGTKEEPIIFTCENDDLEGSISVYNQGLWGGLIILGNAPINTADGEARIEGIPFSEPRGVYGGDDPGDFSGELEYVSIRHGGTDIGLDNEINGLTLGGVGKRTKISHIEVISNKDDGVEVFGGTVNLKYIVVSFCGDDAFDFDLGYQGKCQFLIAIQGEQVGDRLAEHDGGVDPEDGVPYTVPEIYNATFIGSGLSSLHNLISFQDNGGGIYANSIFTYQELGITIEHTNDVSSYERFLENELKFYNSSFYNVAQNSFSSISKVVNRSEDELEDETGVFEQDMIANDNVIEDLGVGKTGNHFNLLPDSAATKNLYPYISDWYEWVNFKGAIDSTNYWIGNWTLLHQEILRK